MNYTKVLPNYYKILQVPKNASRAEIKRAFRDRAKKIHPDTGNKSPRTLSAMRELLTAYETLIHDDLRQEYDLRMRSPRKEFDYREFLLARYEDPESLGKLIFFDLLHDHEKEALDLYDTLVKEKGFNLSDHLDREDFMDCTFLLAERYEKEGDVSATFNLLKTLVSYELEHPYFRHFFQEILDKLRNLLTRKKGLPLAQHIDYLLQIIRMPIREREKSVYMKKAAELYVLYYNSKKDEPRIDEAKRQHILELQKGSPSVGAQIR